MSVTIAIPMFHKDKFRKFMQFKYTASLQRAGAKALWVEIDDLQKAIDQMLTCDGLLLSGGEDVDTMVRRPPKNAVRSPNTATMWKWKC